MQMIPHALHLWPAIFWRKPNTAMSNLYLSILRSMGIELSAEQCRPVCDPLTLESNVPGIYVAGVIVAGSRTNEIFIENGRFHGRQIAAHLKQTLSGT